MAERETVEHPEAYPVVSYFNQIVAFVSLLTNGICTTPSPTPTPYVDKALMPAPKSMK
jgi:hypothetical protein